MLRAETWGGEILLGMKTCAERRDLKRFVVEEGNILAGEVEICSAVCGGEFWLAEEFVLGVV